MFIVIEASVEPRDSYPERQPSEGNMNGGGAELEKVKVWGTTD